MPTFASPSPTTRRALTLQPNSSAYPKWILLPPFISHPLPSSTIVTLMAVLTLLSALFRRNCLLTMAIENFRFTSTVALIP